MKLVRFGDDEHEGGPQVGKQSTDVHGLRRGWIMAKVSSAPAVRWVMPPGLPVLFEPGGSSALAFTARLTGATTAFATSPPPPTIAHAPRTTPTSALGAGSPAAFICCNRRQFRIHEMRKRKPRASCNGRCIREAETLPYSEPPPIATRTAFLTTVPVALVGVLAVWEVAQTAGTHTQ